MISPLIAESPKQLLLIGGSSVIAHAIALSYAADGWTVIFAGRDLAELKASASDVAIRHRTPTSTIKFDALNPESIDNAAAFLVAGGPLPQDMIFVIGYSDGADCAIYDAALADRILATNYVAITRFLSLMLPTIQAGVGHRIVFVSSVAGDRGRKTNFVYGAAKAALNTYAQGLRALLLPHDTSVLTIKLGYVDTRLAYGKTPAFLTSSPRYVALSIRRSIQRKSMVIYLPWIWRPIMTLLRILPESIFIRLPLP